MAQTSAKRSYRNRNILIGVGTTLILVGLGFWFVHKQLKKLDIDLTFDEGTTFV